MLLRVLSFALFPPRALLYLPFLSPSLRTQDSVARTSTSADINQDLRTRSPHIFFIFYLTYSSITDMLLGVLPLYFFFAPPSPPHSPSLPPSPAPSHISSLLPLLLSHLDFPTSFSRLHYLILPFLSSDPWGCGVNLKSDQRREGHLGRSYSIFPPFHSSLLLPYHMYVARGFAYMILLRHTPPSHILSFPPARNSTPPFSYPLFSFPLPLLLLSHLAFPPLSHSSLLSFWPSSDWTHGTVAVKSKATNVVQGGQDVVVVSFPSFSPRLRLLVARGCAFILLYSTLTHSPQTSHSLTPPSHLYLTALTSLLPSFSFPYTLFLTSSSGSGGGGVYFNIDQRRPSTQDYLPDQEADRWQDPGPLTLDTLYLVAWTGGYLHDSLNAPRQLSTHSTWWRGRVATSTTPSIQVAITSLWPLFGPSTGSAGGRRPSLHYGRCFDPQPVARVGGWRAGWREPPLHFGPCFDPQPVVWVGGDLHGSLNASSQLSKHFPIGTSSLPCLIPTRFLYMCSIIGFFSLLKCVLATLLRCACGSTVSSLTYVA